MSSLRRIVSILPKRNLILLNRSNIFITRNNSKLSGDTHKVNNVEKRFLVWTGKFKTIEEIPTYLPPEVVERARNRMRIRIANIMMGLTLVACLIVSISGRRARDRGESLTKQNMEFHQRNREEALKEKAQATE